MRAQRNSARTVRSALQLETLEDRLVPATLVSPTVVTYIDFDGDKVTVAASKPIFQAATIDSVFKFDTGSVNGTNTPQQLQLIDLTALATPSAASGTNLTISVKRVAAPGDGLANVGRIDAAGIDLKNVSVAGDLGSIAAGDATLTTAAIRSLATVSMGRYGTTTQGSGSPTLRCDIAGTLGQLRVATDVKDTHFLVTGGALGNIGPVTIGGSLLGGSAMNSGKLHAEGKIGNVVIAGDIVGGSGIESGQIRSEGSLQSVTVGGSLQGGSMFYAGRIFSAGAMGPVTIGGDVRGGSDIQTGSIVSQSSVAAVTVKGSLIGATTGAAHGAGSILTFGDLGPVQIGGNVAGGLGTGTQSGSILVGGKLMSARIAGSLIGGASNENGTLRSGGTTGLIRILGDMVGGSSTPTGSIQVNGNLAGVVVGGSMRGGTATGSGYITVGGNVGYIEIGVDVIGTVNTSGVILVNGNAGKITLGGSLVGTAASNNAVVIVSGTLNSVRLGGNVVGGDNAGSGTIQQTGYIVGQRIGSVFVGGSITSGANTGGGILLQSGQISATDDLGTVTVVGSLVGNATNSVHITARGQAVPTAKSDVALASLTVGGRIEYANILAGYGVNANALNGNAQIGSVRVKAGWLASNLVAGVAAGSDGDFGTSDDAVIGGGTLSKIGAVIVSGPMFGSTTSGDHFGIVARQLSSFRLNGFTFSLMVGAGNDLFPGQTIGFTGDTSLLEVA